MVEKLSEYLDDYQEYFRTETNYANVLPELYISGLLKTEHGKRNMERINEELDIIGDGYQKIQQFISDSPWNTRGLMTAIALQMSTLYSESTDYYENDVGYIIDETAHLKKGPKSVGVARQYAGVIGKVENCQVGVHSSLVWQLHTSLVNSRIFLPKSWTEDKIRCDIAGIPDDEREFKTKPQLALEMLKSDVESGVKFGWVGGDGLYGHGYELSNAIDDLELTFLLDIHKDQTVYLEEPSVYLPNKKPGRGRKPTSYKTDAVPVEVQDYHKKLTDNEWQEVKVRNTVKGVLKLSVHVRQVWTWDEIEEKARSRTLVITVNKFDNKIKYSLSNSEIETTAIERFAFMQAQRYWVERAFQDAKSELGMSDYQVRKWNGWYHHMGLVMLALSFIVRERMYNKAEIPLLSCRDVRILIIALMMGDQKFILRRLQQMEKRHKQREMDIKRHFKT
jgi:SRSO17 transposase